MQNLVDRRNRLIDEYVRTRDSISWLERRIRHQQKRLQRLNRKICEARKQEVA